MIRASVSPEWRLDKPRVFAVSCAVRNFPENMAGLFLSRSGLRSLIGEFWIFDFSFKLSTDAPSIRLSSKDQPESRRRRRTRPALSLTKRHSMEPSSPSARKNQAIFLLTFSGK